MTGAAGGTVALINPRLLTIVDSQLTTLETDYGGCEVFGGDPDSVVLYEKNLFPYHLLYAKLNQGNTAVTAVFDRIIDQVLSIFVSYSDLSSSVIY